MGIHGDRSESRTATYTLTVGVAVAIVILLLNLPALDLIWRLVAIVALVVLEALNLAVLVGARRRYLGWRTSRRRLRVLNLTSGLIPELGRLTQDTHEVLYGDEPESVYNMVRAIEQKEGVGRGLEARVSDLRVHYQLIGDLAESRGYWELNPFLYFARSIARHFQFFDSILKECYEIAEVTAMEQDVIDNWETGKENYNGLRKRWQDYFRRIRDDIELRVKLKGKAATSLPQPALVGKKG